MSDLADRLVFAINKLQTRGNGLSGGDLDELRILHKYCRSKFPNSFNEALDAFPEGASAATQHNHLSRLTRILEVENSIPQSVRESILVDTLADDLIPTFSLEKKDKERVVELCAAMRKIIFATSEFDVPHRTRLLNRIAAIEAEINKPKGIFDVVRGGINDLGETLGKFGIDIKPLTDRMQEVAKIARDATKEYDQLPPPDDVKRLPPPDEE